MIAPRSPRNLCESTGSAAAVTRYLRPGSDRMRRKSAPRTNAEERRRRSQSPNLGEAAAHHAGIVREVAGLRQYDRADACTATHVVFPVGHTIFTGSA
jgi:hypothetical protein